MNELSEAVYEESVFPDFRPLARYMGELFGVAFLCAQSGDNLQPADLNVAIDEGSENFKSTRT